MICDNINTIIKKANSIMFLTDGTPTAGVLDLSTIVNTVHFVAKQNNIAINSIAFGQEVNHEFLTQISAQTNGMVLKVPVRPDAAYMMQDFYFETIARLQKSSGINDPIVNLLDQHKNYIDFFPYTEYSRLSFGEEVRFHFSLGATVEMALKSSWMLTLLFTVRN